MERFANRQEAGRLLGEKLISFKDQNPVVLAIPRGGVPLAFEVAKILKCPLDLLMVKKIGAPRQPELAVGAVSEDAKPIFNESLVQALSLKRTYLNQTAKEKISEIQEQLKKFRGSKKTEPIKGKTVILIDDGIATGSTLMAAIQFLRQKEPKKIIVAAPVGAQETIDKIQRVADQVVCLSTPEKFMAVGLWYEDFTQVSDEEVVRLIGESRFLKDEAQTEITIQDGSVKVFGDLTHVEKSKGLIIFAHGSGSSRKSSRNQFVAKELNKIGFSTLLFDLLSEKESLDRSNVFDLNLLAKRLLLATDAGLAEINNPTLPLGYFGASTGAGAALVAAAQSKKKISAVVSRGGRPDLADKYLEQVSSPTLLIVGQNDIPVIAMNKSAADKIKNSRLVIVPGATHLFEEPGTLEEVVEYAAGWFTQYLQNKKNPTRPQEKVVTELEKKSHAIRDAQSWDELIENVASSKVVMLGEATHGTEEFYSIRRNISERLIRDHGFKFIAVEGDWPDCQKLNDYIHFDKGESAKHIMREFHRWPTWMWANDETALLIEWMKSYRASFYGLDVYSLFESLDYVIEFTKNLDPELAKSVKSQYACFDPFDRDEKAYARYLVQFPEGCRKDVVANLRKLLRLRVDDISGKAPDLFSAQQNARIVAHAENYYRSMLFGGPDSWNVRDQHMIDTLDMLLKQEGPESKCIVWAHNSHIGDYHATDMLEEGYVNLGGLARERFGINQVSLVGFGTFEGQVLAGPAWEGRETIMDLPPARESSFEYFCHKVAEDLETKRFYTLFDSEARQGSLGHRGYGHRAVGVVYSPLYDFRGRNYVETIPAKRYDAFVFVDKTTALKSIPTHKRKSDMPETWPGGV
ncbi:erythromycin esterase family protein [Bdellovibrio bacteriovorus]|uniref:erythromycin esterase family protein n=1 Tax=Bdellovibrio TaxID=958 RepID=UPI0035A8EFEB